MLRGGRFFRGHSVVGLPIICWTSCLFNFRHVCSLWVFGPCRPLKFRFFQNPRRRTAAMWKTVKSRYSQQRFDRCPRNLARWRVLTLLIPPTIKISAPNIRRGSTPLPGARAKRAGRKSALPWSKGTTAERGIYPPTPLAAMPSVTTHPSKPVYQSLYCYIAVLCRVRPSVRPSVYTPPKWSIAAAVVATRASYHTLPGPMSENSRREIPASASFLLKPNSITISWSQTGPKLVTDLQRARW